MSQSISSSEFDEHVIHTQGRVLVDFFATWCGPCKMMAPALEDSAKALDGSVAVYKVDIDLCQDLALKYGIVSVPTLVLFADGQEISRVVGAQTEKAIVAFCMQ